MGIDNRKRTHCCGCGKRVNLVWDKKKDMFYCLCKNCGCHGEVKYKKNKIVNIT